MSYSYASGPLTYGPQPNGLYYDGMEKQKSSSIPAAIAGGVVGASGGAIAAACKKNTMIKNGEFTDSFVKNVYERYIEKAGEGSKEAYKQSAEIIKKIDKIKTTEELKTLLENNKEAAKELCTELKQTPEEFVSNITKENLEANKKTIKERITAGNNTRFQNMKNQIQACWDKQAKKFAKADSVKEEVFNVIEKAGKKGNKPYGKYAAIGALGGGALGFIAHKFMA